MKSYGMRWGSLAGGLVLLGLAACGGGGGSGGGGYSMNPTPQPPMTGASYKSTVVVSDGSVAAAYMDPHLKNTWGIAFNPNGFVWVANNHSDSSTLYDGNGIPQSLVVDVPGDPTGIVFNGTGGFNVSNGSTSSTALFIFAGEGGVISGWSPAVDASHALSAVDNSASGAIYKGLAIASKGGANFIYATDFHNNKIDVFDSTYAPASTAGGFKDAAIPAGYAPFGIQAIAGKLYVTYAQQDGAAEDDVHGPGLGMVDVFDADGNLLQHLISGGALNAPWGIAMAPANFGDFSGKLLIANFGDGKINAYDPATGAMAGTLSQGGTAIVLDGLWGIAFGNGLNNQPVNTLFYTAGPNNEANGLYGRIDLQ